MAEEPDLGTNHGRLRWARQQAGFEEAADFARAVRVKEVTYRAHENGQNGFAKYAPDYAAKLGVPSDWLMRGGVAPTVPRRDDPVVRSEVRSTGLTPQQAREAWSVRDAALVPLLGTAFGGDWEEEIELTELYLSEVLDNLDRPPSLVNDEEAYAIEIVGDSMYPRFKPGERAFVSPRASPRPGDDVVVQLTNPDATADLEQRVTMVLIKELVRQSSAFVELRQFNPGKTFRVPRERVRRMHRVKGRL